MKKYWLPLGLLPLAILDYYLAYGAAFYGWMTAYYTDHKNVQLAQKYFALYFSAFAVVSLIMVYIVVKIIRAHRKTKQDEKR